MKKIQAIPTVYRGIELKSRFEAQCAFLLDKLGWEWEYEPQSYMLPNGVAFTPDFLVRELGLFIECRGYKTRKGWRQLKGFAELVAGGISIGDEDYVPATNFIILNGDEEPTCFRRGEQAQMVMLLHCQECGWRLPPIGPKALNTARPFSIYCESCIAPLDPPCSVIDKAAVVTVAKGKILVNGFGVEDFDL